MFQDNPLLAQLKQQLHSQTPRVEGVVKGTEKGFGFLEVDAHKSYFIPPPQMKKVMHGDRIQAALYTEKAREIAEPETLIEPFLNRFIGRIQKKTHDERLFITPDHPLLKEPIPCRAVQEITSPLQAGDWVVAQMRRHPLKGDRGFFAEVTQFITHRDDHFAPWWVTLSRHQIPRDTPEWEGGALQDEGLSREDLTSLPFITIDSASTEDMDDALYVQENGDGTFTLTVAIADPTAYVMPDSKIDKIAYDRAFTTYLPGFNIPMLPRHLSENLCSLHPNARRPVLACRVTLHKEGGLTEDIHFFAGWIESKAKLVYNDVSDWLEGLGSWHPPNSEIAQQIQLLQLLAERRTQWRQQHALIYKDRPDYRFILGEEGKIIDIMIDLRRVANRIVEECMITANICAAIRLREQLNFGIYNIHRGFDTIQVEHAVTLLQHHNITTNADTLLTLKGFCALQRQLNTLANPFLNNRIRRFQSIAEISTEPSPHFGLGLETYATWTSPIRKYGDMVNHRLLKALISGKPIPPLQPHIALQLTERRRLNRIAERDISDWLYTLFLKDKLDPALRFDAEIIDLSRGGLRVRLLDNGATAFIPSSFIHPVRDEVISSQENGTLQIKGKIHYSLGDTLTVMLNEVRLDTRTIIAKPAI